MFWDSIRVRMKEYRWIVCVAANLEKGTQEYPVLSLYPDDKEVLRYQNDPHFRVFMTYVEDL